MKFWIAIIFLVMGCGSGEKRDFPLSSTGGDQPSKSTACPLSYSPIPLLREGADTIASPDLLPKGTYTFLSAAYFLREESQPEKIKAHFTEEIRSGSVLIRQICADTLPEGEIYEQEFPVFQAIQILNDTKTYQPLKIIFWGQEGQMKLSKGARQNPVPGSVNDVLQDWDQWRIYVVGSNYEFRMTSLDVRGGYAFRKFAVLRFNLAHLSGVSSHTKSEK